ncbi:MAG: hypothetical protein LQ338_000538 [Usnochroma carphineum]|nr:MAG: hypothetical protein LQ338_000538 [Usnochroma carphineum]
MTDRTFRDPSPSRAKAANLYRDEPPPVPALPKDYVPPPPVPARSIRRPASVEPPERVTSPVPRAGGRGVSLDRGPGLVQGKQKKKKQATKLDTVGEAERIQNRESINFSRPMSPQNSPPTSPLRELKTKPAANQAQPSTPIANMGALRDGEADNIQHAVQETANKPVKKKKKAVARDLAEGSHFAGAKPVGTAFETPSKPPASVSSTPSPVEPKLHAAGAAAPSKPATKKKKKQVVSSECSQGSYASDSDSAMSDRSSSTDRPRAFNTRAAGLLAKQPSIVREDREGEEQEEGERPVKQDHIQNGSISAAPSAPASISSATTKQHKKSASQPPVLSTAVDKIPLDATALQKATANQPDAMRLSTQQPRPKSLSPGRAAHFLAQPMYETPDGVKHQPPARSVSPAKSALKYSPSSRGASPVGFATSGSKRLSGVAASEASDNGSVVSDEGGRLIPAKKKTARVSFDEDSVVVGRASTPPATDSPTILSPQHKESGSNSFLGFGRRRKGEVSPNESDLDDGIKPTPTLPSFGSIRGKNKGEVDTAPRRIDDKTANQRPSLDTQTSSDQVIGHVLAQEFASRTQSAVEPSRQLQTSNDPLPPEVTSVEGTGYHSDSEDGNSDVGAAQKAAENINVLVANEAKPVVDEPTSSEPRSEILSQAEPKTADMQNGAIPQIAILPATPGIGSNEGEKEDWFKMPGGFGAVNDDEAIQADAGIEEKPAVDPSTSIAAHQATEPTPANLGISEPEPESTNTSTAGSPLVGHVADSLHQQTEANNDDDSDDTGNSIYSDAAEDISDLEGDGFGSINAIIESPVVPKTPFVAALMPESPAANGPSPSAKPTRPTPVQRNESELSEPPAEEGWDRAQAYWSGLSQSRKEQIERAAISGAANDEHSIQPEVAPPPEEKPKKKKMVKKTPQPSDPPLPPWPDKEFRGGVARPASPPNGAMKQSMRSSQPDSQPHMRASMRNGVPPQSTLGNSVQIPETKPASRGALPKKARPVSAATAEYDKPSGKAAASHGRAASMDVAPKTAAPVVPQSKKTKKPAVRRATSNGSDSSSSFRKSRRPSTSDGGKYTMKRSMRGASTDGRPQSAYYPNRPGSLSGRSPSPPGRRPFGSAGPSGMRTSMRNSIDSGVGSRTKLPSGGFGFSRSKQKQRPAKRTGSRFSSRFGDSSDEGEGFPNRQSRFADSSDEEDEKTGLTPVRGIPRRIDEGDSTDLEDSSNAPSPVIKADEKPIVPATKSAAPAEGSALSTGSLRTGAPGQANGPQAKQKTEKDKKKRSFFGSRRKQQHSQPPLDVSLPATNPSSNAETKTSHPLDANYATPTSTPSTPRSPKAAKFLGDSPAAATTASPKSQASPKPPKLQRRNTPKRFTSDSWPLPEMPAGAAEKARPNTSDGAGAKPLAVGTMRPQSGPRRLTVEGEPVNGVAADAGKDAAGKKKRFPMLRKALGL